MPTGQLTPVLRYLARLSQSAESAALSDAQLLLRFVDHGDEAAFAVLVRRHGPMVLAVCRRTLRDLHDAEDAFQATFLLLVRKAGSLRQPELLGPWLHGVAHRTALKARSVALKRRAREQPVADVPAAATDDLLWRDLRPALDDAIRGLPHKYRLPFVLCNLEGLTHAQAARQLGCPMGTLATRLSRARERLRIRLTKQGVALSSGALALALANEASALPLGLVQTVVRSVAALRVSSSACAGAIPGQVATLTKGVGQAMFMEKLRFVSLAVLLLLGMIGSGAGWLAYRADAQEVGFQAPRPSEPTKDAKDADAPVEQDRGDGAGLSVGIEVDLGRAAKLVQGKADEADNRKRLPGAPAPLTGLAVLDGEGRIVLRLPGRNVYYQPRTTYVQREDGGRTAVTSYEMMGREEVRLVEAKTAQAFTTDGKRVEAKALAEMLKKEVAVLVSADGRPVDPFHLQLIREGTLILVLPEMREPQTMPSALPAIAAEHFPPTVPAPAPLVPQGR